jgi:5-methylcytosine-specific restriction endonuclease McrA
VTDRICSIDDCGRVLYCRQLCRKHYCERYLPGYWQRPEVMARHRDASKRYYEKNSERRAATAKAWREANRDRVAQATREWQLANRDRTRVSRRQNQALRKARKAATQTAPIDYSEILREYGMVCHICGGDIADQRDLHFDHVIPLARGGEHSVENIRPSHARCNLQKGPRLIAG